MGLSPFIPESNQHAESKVKGVANEVKVPMANGHCSSFKDCDTLFATLLLGTFTSVIGTLDYTFSHV